MPLALSPLPLTVLLPWDIRGCKGGGGGCWNHSVPCNEDLLPGCLWGRCPEDPCPAGVRSRTGMGSGLGSIGLVVPRRLPGWPRNRTVPTSITTVARRGCQPTPAAGHPTGPD